MGLALRFAMLILVYWLPLGQDRSICYSFRIGKCTDKIALAFQRPGFISCRWISRETRPAYRRDSLKGSDAFN